VYHGEVVWNRSRKRDARGKVKQQARPESEWLRVPAPKLRIVSDDLWTKAHARLAQTREAYLRINRGRLWSRPLDGSARKYLLVGLARCGCCGGSLEVRSRSHGSQRQYYYACSSYYRRGKAVCGNKLEIPLRAADDAVIAALESELLDDALVDAVVRKVLTRVVPTGPAVDERRTTLEQERRDIEREAQNLVTALAKMGTSPTITAALKEHEARHRQIDHELSALEQREQLSTVEQSRFEAQARKLATDWRSLLRRHTPQARQIVSKVCRDKIVFTPEQRRAQRGYRFRAEASIVPLLTGMVPEFSQAVASPTGTNRRWRVRGDTRKAA
jgi:site-specific DNA recombinase